MKGKVLLTAAILGILSVLTVAACTGPQGPAGPAGKGLEPQAQNLKLIMGEGEVITEAGEGGAAKDELTGEFHRWEPDVLVVFKGDTVKLTVENPRATAHMFTLPDFGVTTPILAKRGGKAEVTFVADKPGVFPYSCGLAYDQAQGFCALDHRRQVGYLIVLER